VTFEQLIEKLEKERFNPEEGRDEFDRGWREGWTMRGQSLARELRTLMGLAELKASDV
jgi:hypothetical protein